MPLASVNLLSFFITFVYKETKYEYKKMVLSVTNA